MENRNLSAAAWREIWKCKPLPDGTLEIRQYQGSEQVVQVPSVIGKKTVTAIRAFAIRGSSASLNVKEIILPDTIQTLKTNGLDGDHAWDSNGYTGCFTGCESLEKINLPPNLTEISAYAFKNCKALKHIVIPQHVTKIGNRAFHECTNLERIDLPNNLHAIGNEAFSECTNLERIDLPNNVHTIADGAFSECTNLKWIDLPQNLRTIGQWAFYKCKQLEHISLPYGLETIGSSAFSMCSSLTSIEFPETVKEFDGDFFYLCRKCLESIIIRGSNTGIKFHSVYFNNVDFDSLEPFSISASDVLLPKNCVVYVPSGSVAEAYAKQHKLGFVRSIDVLRE